jgi:DNA recombination protein RmuC
MEKNIVVATPSTLLSTLHIVKQIWRHDAQSANAAKLAETAQKLAGKVSLYVESVEKLGNTLERARIDHEAISHHLTAGKGNLVKRIRDFEELGVKVQKKLPEGLVEKAMLEIG